MGNCTFKADKDKEGVIAIGRNMFQFEYIIGKGGFGKVWRVQKKNTSQHYALKEMSKARIIAKHSERSIMNERQILSRLKNQSAQEHTNTNNRFIVNMVYAFQDREAVYLVMDLLSGGDLRYHLIRKKTFTEAETSIVKIIESYLIEFMVACIVTGLEYIQANGIIHRDIKPENLIFGSDGYLRITDFGIARNWSPENAHETSGTPGYMAPEVMCKQNHGVAVDYFAVGVIMHECMTGHRPYKGRTRKEIREQILLKQAVVRKSDLAEPWSAESIEFVNALLQRKPVNRLGLNGGGEIKNHPWFAKFPWEELAAHRLKAPFIPSGDNFDPVGEDKEDPNEDQVKACALLLRRDSVQGKFEGYYYDENIVMDKVQKELTNVSSNHCPVPSQNTSQNVVL